MLFIIQAKWPSHYNNFIFKMFICHSWIPEPQQQYVHCKYTAWCLEIILVLNLAGCWLLVPQKKRWNTNVFFRSEQRNWFEELRRTLVTPSWSIGAAFFGLSEDFIGVYWLYGPLLDELRWNKNKLSSCWIFFVFSLFWVFGHLFQLFRAVISGSENVRCNISANFYLSEMFLYAK